MKKILWRALTSRLVRSIVNPKYGQLRQLEEGRVFIAVSRFCRLGDLTMYNHAASQLQDHYSLAYCCTHAYFKRHRSFLQQHSLVKEILCFPDSIWGMIRQLSRLRREKADAVIIEQGAMVPPLFFYLAGVPIICALKGVTSFATHHLDIEKHGHHYTQLGACVLDVLSGKTPLQDKRPFFQYAPAGIEGMQHEAGHIVSVHVGGGAYWNRKWPLEHYRELCRLFLDTYEGKLVLVGGKDEHAGNEELKEALVADCNAEGRVLNCCGADLNTMANIFAASDVFVGNDSGPMHMATAVNTRVIAIFGPSQISRLHPSAFDQKNVTLHADLACVPCGAEKCRLATEQQYSCLLSLPVGKVWEKLQEALQ
jgi:ADP-heptose:LPS heptosyltransferase